MLFVSVVNVALGWGWHIAYRARHHWSLKREGALIAAAAVALIGAVDTVRSARGSHQPNHLIAPTAALTASATPVLTEAQPLEIKPADPPPETVAAAQPPAVPPMVATDAIGDKILERLGEPTATGSVDAAAPADDPDGLDPVDAATLVKPQPAKPPKAARPAKAEQPGKAAKSARIADRRKAKPEPKAAD